MNNGFVYFHKINKLPNICYKLNRYVINVYILNKCSIIYASCESLYIFIYVYIHESSQIQLWKLKTNDWK